ncbi:hypothetical protein CEXT_138551 [Caerostris extrusa]|uniref:Uncharacterized protein n=1 Tax=Caerostris extrusa TaxID=172846 RepID=A0AAV4VNE7_CAEEX|nr:hypothetical protein CEXT_138551 [Caerostris extrusa]
MSKRETIKLERYQVPKIKLEKWEKTYHLQPRRELSSMLFNMVSLNCLSCCPASLVKVVRAGDFGNLVNFQNDLHYPQIPFGELAEQE